MIRGLPSMARLALGPSRLGPVLLYNDVVHASVSSSVSSVRHTRTTTAREIYTRMQMKDLFDDFNLINHKQ
jgi:hypothetical protein